jgi:hypothetical protein
MWVFISASAPPRIPVLTVSLALGWRMPIAFYIYGTTIDGVIAARE